MPKNAVVRINAEQPKYVCRAGHKLEAALEHFGVDVAGLTALDAGLSTGGFTDCLLQRGVGHVRPSASCAAGVSVAARATQQLRASWEGLGLLRCPYSKPLSSG